MTYEQALAFIHGAYGRGEKQGLANMVEMLKRLGNPEKSFPALHIAGTNGKGSVCAFLHGALHAAGYRVGLYTSPYLQRYNERIRIGGLPIADHDLAQVAGEVAALVTDLRQEGIRPTEFEIGTAIAFLAFARAKVDIAVVEVGLGGRLDPTNVITPLVCAIAAIGMDHEKALGHTIEAIAGEKAGIAKPGVPLVLSGTAGESVRWVVERACLEVGAPFSMAGDTDMPLGLLGAHQRHNAGLALAVLQQLQAGGMALSPGDIRRGLQNTCWPGRLEWAQGDPPILLDGAHNPQGVQALSQYIGALPEVKTVLLCGIMGDKDWRPMAAAFAAFAHEAVTVAPQNPRSLAPDLLAEALRSHQVPALSAPSPAEGLAMAMDMAGPEGRVVCAGSLYLVGEVRTLLGLPEGVIYREDK